jgi:hypothetical protein
LYAATVSGQDLPDRKACMVTHATTVMVMLRERAYVGWGQEENCAVLPHSLEVLRMLIIFRKRRLRRRLVLVNSVDAVVLIVLLFADGATTEGRRIPSSAFPEGAAM